MSTETDFESHAGGPWYPSDPKTDPLRCFLVNSSGERLDVQVDSGIDYSELDFEE